MTYGPSGPDMFRQAAIYIRSDPKGREAGRPTRRAAAQVRAGDQAQDRQGAGAHDPAVAAPAGGSGDRVTPPRTATPAPAHTRRALSRVRPAGARAPPPPRAPAHDRLAALPVAKAEYVSSCGISSGS